MRLRHVIITRFGFRPVEGHPDAMTINREVRPGTGSDPLDPARLELRFKLFEVVCLPSVLGQTCDDFTWAIVVDPALPQVDRERLARLVAPHRATVIHDYDPDQPIGEVEWLAPHLDLAATDYLLTSNLDDDDCLPRRFAETLRGLIADREDTPAPVELFGARTTLQWDLALSDAAPRGYAADWHRRNVAVSSAGFSLLARQPEFPLTVAGLRHSDAAILLDWDRPANHPNLEQQRARLTGAAERAGLALTEHPPPELVHDYSVRAGAPVMTNHTDNITFTRLHEEKPRTVVTGPESFPDVDIDWDAVDRHAAAFRVTLRSRLRYWRRRARDRWRGLRKRLGWPHEIDRPPEDQAP